MKRLCVMLIMMGLSSVSLADTVYGLYADANYWQTSSDSTQQIQTNSNKTFDNKSRGQLMVNASLEHGIPLVPNMRVRYADLKSTQKENANFTTNTNSTDAILYYEVLDNVVSVDVGVGVKRMVGSQQAFGQDYIKLDKTLPMAYANVGAKLPLTGLSVKAELGLAKASQASATDALAEIKYNVVDKALVDVGVKAGYRTLTYKNDKVVYPHLLGGKHGYEMNFKGPYVGVEVHF